MANLYKIDNEDDMVRFASCLAAVLGGHDVVLLHGDLGAGKTFMCRHIIQSMMNQAVEVPSPTFTLHQGYETPRGMVGHFDLYRLSDPSEIFEIGFQDALADGMVLIEWPDRLGVYKPDRYMDISIAHDAISENARMITLSCVGMDDGHVDEINMALEGFYAG